MGHRGMLGQALHGELLALGHEVFATDREVDITSRDAVLDFAKSTRPSLILNAAAYTQVDAAETEEPTATAINGTGVRHLCEAARGTGAGMVHVSTDYVFDGTATRAYPEDAPRSPRSAYGRSKLLGELACEELLLSQGHPCWLVRTSWLFGPGGNNFVRTLLGLMRERAEVRVVVDQRGRPTYSLDLARALSRLSGLSGAAAAPPGFYHFANDGEVSWHAFTLTIAEEARALGLALRCASVLPVSTAEYPRPAPRPAYSVLDTTRFRDVTGAPPRPWRDALREYLPLLSQGTPAP